MRVLRVQLEGLTTSFRYPFFVLGRQPTYEMPPPATIYGHICSAVGDLVDISGLRFAYWFTHEGKSTDLEHTHMLSTSGGRMVPTGSAEKVPKNTAGAINILNREFFFRPRLTLYINRPDLEAAFHSPRYPVVLGRSQDLASYVGVETVELERAGTAYYEHTLLPVTLQTALVRGVGITMPQRLDVMRNRTPTYGQYIMLTQRLRPDEATALVGDDGHWIDPETPLVDGAHRGIVFLSFEEEPG